MIPTSPCTKAETFPTIQYSTTLMMGGPTGWGMWSWKRFSSYVLLTGGPSMEAFWRWLVGNGGKFHHLNGIAFNSRLLDSYTIIFFPIICIQIRLSKFPPLHEITPKDAWWCWLANIVVLKTTIMSAKAYPRTRAAPCATWKLHPSHLCKYIILWCPNLWLRKGVLKLWSAPQQQL